MKSPALIALLLCASAAVAAPDQKPEHPKRPGPPPEAFEICKDKPEGAAVEMKTPRGDTVKGSCRMVMIPDRGEGRGER